MKVGSQQPVEDIYKKVAVFEVGEYSQVDHHTGGKKQLLFPLLTRAVDQVSKGVVGNGGEDQQGEEIAAGEVIKDQAHDEQVSVAYGFSPVHQYIKAQQDGEEYPEMKPGKKHGLFLGKGQYFSQILHTRGFSVYIPVNLP